MLKWGWLSLLVVVIDQITKQLAASQLGYQQPVPLLPGLNLTLAHNTGAAFSFLAAAGGWQRWFFALLALAVSGILLVWLKRLERHQRWLALALALVLGGALGNLYDRVTLGYVIDFLDLYYGRWHWPAFNVADMAISAGAVMLLLDALSDVRTHKA